MDTSSFVRRDSGISMKLVAKLYSNGARRSRFPGFHTVCLAKEK